MLISSFLTDQGIEHLRCLFQEFVTLDESEALQQGGLADSVTVSY